MTERTRGGFQEGFLEIVEEQLKLCQEELRSYEEQIERKQQEIAELSEEREAAVKRTQLLRDLLSGAGLDAERPTAPVQQPAPRPPFADADAVVELIRERGGAMHYKNIHRTLVERGFEIGGEGNADTLLSRYHRDARLRRVAGGTYDLAERYTRESTSTVKPRSAPSALSQRTNESLSLPARPARGLTNDMTVAEMAAAVLRQAGRPLHFHEITDRMLRTGAWKTTGKTPEATVNSVMVVDIQNNGENSTFVRTDRGVYGLREWED